MVLFGGLTTQSFYGSSWWWAYVLVALFVLLVLRGALRTIRGARIADANRLLTRPMILLGLYVLAIFGTVAAGLGSTYQALSLLSIALDAVAIGAGFAVARAWIPGHLSLERRPPEMDYYFRISPLIPIVYVLMFLARVVVESALGTLPFSVPNSLDGFSALSIYALIAVDAAWGLSTGLNFGRAWAIRTEYLARTRAATGAPLLPAP